MKTFDEALMAMEAKVQEMVELRDELLASDVSENTKRTQKFQRNKAIHEMLVCTHFMRIAAECCGQTSLKEVGVDGDLMKWLESMVTLTRERKARYAIEVHEGDNIMQLMQKYENVKDVYHKLMKAAEENGLKADFGKQVFVKA